MKIITWNTNGFKEADILELLEKYSPDVMCVQEVGSIRLLDQAGARIPLGGGTGYWNDFCYIYYIVFR